MAISNELSSDVAIAILEKNRSPQELKQLKDVILQVHSELQKMSEAEPRRSPEKNRAAKTEKAECKTAALVQLEQIRRLLAVAPKNLLSKE